MRAVYQKRCSASFKAATAPAAQQKRSGSRPAVTRVPINPCASSRPPPDQGTCPQQSCDMWQPRGAGGPAGLCLFLIHSAHAQHRLGGCSLRGCWKVLWHCFPSLPSRVWELEGPRGGWRGLDTFTYGSRESAVPTTCDGSLPNPAKPR